MMLPLKHKHIDAPLKVTHRSNKKFRQVEIMDYLIANKKSNFKRFKTEVKLYFTIGLFTSLLMVTTVFEWKTSDLNDDMQIAQVDVNSEVVMDIPITEQPPPPPQKLLQQPNIIEVSEEEVLEEIKVDFDIEITSEEAVVDVQSEEELDEPKEEIAAEIFTIVENQPQPKGGLANFYSYVSNNIKYPDNAKRLGIQGKVFVSFVVNADGSLSDFKVVKGIGGGCDEEAIKVLKNAPNWEPGKQRGKPVRVRMVIPIYFMLKDL